MTDEINEILRLKSALAQDGELPSGCAFLSDDILLAYPQADGDARYPYACDGLTLWAHSSGNIIMNESKFNIFPDTTRGKEPARKKRRIILRKRRKLFPSCACLWMLRSARIFLYASRTKRSKKPTRMSRRTSIRCSRMAVRKGFGTSAIATAKRQQTVLL